MPDISKRLCSASGSRLPQRLAAVPQGQPNPSFGSLAVPTFSRRPARSVAAQIAVDLEDDEVIAGADRLAPPAATASQDQRLELCARQNADVGMSPRLLEHLGECLGIGYSRATHAYL